MAFLNLCLNSIFASHTKLARCFWLITALLLDCPLALTCIGHWPTSAGADTRDSARGSQGLATWSSVPQWHNVIVACQIIKYCSQISLQRNQFQSRLRCSGGREPQWLNFNLNLMYQDQKLEDDHLEHCEIQVIRTVRVCDPTESNT